MWQRAGGSYKKPRIPGEEKGNLACGKAAGPDRSGRRQGMGRRPRGSHRPKRLSCRPKRARGRRCGAASNDDRYQDHGNRETTKAHAHRQRSSWWLNSPRRRAALVCMETWAQAVPPTAIAPGTANHSRHHSFGLPKCRGSVNVKADACRWSGE
jgi:hypothetical protein